jgi:hypothetical protein
LSDDWVTFMILWFRYGMKSITRLYITKMDTKMIEAERALR